MPTPRGVSRFVPGPSGIALVRLYKTKCKVEMEDGSLYELSKESIPSYLTKGDKLYVSLSEDTTRIRSARPISGTHIVGFIGYTRPEGRDHPPYPVLKERKWRDKKTGVLKRDEYYGFTARMQILEGDHEGMRLYGPLEYRFTEVEQAGTQVAGIWGKTARAYVRLITFMESAGFDWDTDTIPWSENVLPFTEELLFERCQPFQVTLGGKFGWPEQYSGLSTHLVKPSKKKLAKLLKKLAEETNDG